MTKRELKESWKKVGKPNELVVDSYLIEIFTTYSKDNLEIPIYTLAKELQEALYLPFCERLGFVRGVLE